MTDQQIALDASLLTPPSIGRRERESGTRDTFRTSPIPPPLGGGLGATLADFDIDYRLGKGAYGVVHRAKRRSDGKLYVIKTIPITELGEDERHEAVNEVNILASINSPYVVKYYDSFMENEELHIVMEYCNRGDLQRIIGKLKRDNCRNVAEEKIWSIFVQVAIGLHHLHSKQILHRDMKAANVFIHKDEMTGLQAVKIGDLGVAKLLDSHTSFATTLVGTPYYLSPELCQNKKYNEKSDIWSLGVLLYQCCTLKLPFEANNPYVLMTKIIKGKYEPISSRYLSPQLVELVRQLLTPDSELRPSLRQILSIPHVQEKCNMLGFDLPPDVPVVVPLLNNPSSYPSSGSSLPPPSSSSSSSSIPNGSSSGRLPMLGLSPGFMAPVQELEQDEQEGSVNGGGHPNSPHHSATAAPSFPPQQQSQQPTSARENKPSRGIGFGGFLVNPFRKQEANRIDDMESQVSMSEVSGRGPVYSIHSPAIGRNSVGGGTKRPLHSVKDLHSLSNGHGAQEEKALFSGNRSGAAAGAGAAGGVQFPPIIQQQGGGQAGSIASGYRAMATNSSVGGRVNNNAASPSSPGRQQMADSPTLIAFHTPPITERSPSSRATSALEAGGPEGGGTSSSVTTPPIHASPRSGSAGRKMVGGGNALPMLEGLQNLDTEAGGFSKSAREELEDKIRDMEELIRKTRAQCRESLTEEAFRQIYEFFTTNVGNSDNVLNDQQLVELEAIIVGGCGGNVQKSYIVLFNVQKLLAQEERLRELRNYINSGGLLTHRPVSGLSSFNSSTSSPLSSSYRSNDGADGGGNNSSREGKHLAYHSGAGTSNREGTSSPYFIPPPIQEAS